MPYRAFTPQDNQNIYAGIPGELNTLNQTLGGVPGALIGPRFSNRLGLDGTPPQPYGDVPAAAQLGMERGGIPGAAANSGLEIAKSLGGFGEDVASTLIGDPISYLNRKVDETFNTEGGIIGGMNELGEGMVNAAASPFQAAYRGMTGEETSPIYGSDQPLIATAEGAAQIDPISTALAEPTGKTELGSKFTIPADVLKTAGLPDLSASEGIFEKSRPKAPVTEDTSTIDKILQGLAGANIDPSMSKGEMLLQIGSAMTRQGVGKKAKSKAEQKEFEKDTAEFEQQSAQRQDARAQQEFQNQREVNETTRNLLMPTITGSNIVTKKMGDDGSLELTVHNTKDSVVSNKMAAARTLAENDPDGFFNMAFQLNPTLAMGAVQELGGQDTGGAIDLKLGGYSDKDISKVSRSQFMDFMKTNTQQAYAQIVSQLGERGALQAIAGK